VATLAVSLVAIAPLAIVGVSPALAEAAAVAGRAGAVLGL
tara:strand:+ start:99 stop:218 length:120 start_codon:yes stop_codon:yes gene_type:complete